MEDNSGDISNDGKFAPKRPPQVFSNDRHMATEFTIDGEVKLMRIKGVETRVPHPEEELQSLPASFKEKHQDAMIIMLKAVNEAKAIKERKVPLTREELIESGVPKTIVRELEGFGLIQQRIVSLLRGAKAVGGRAVVYFTPQGHAYVREKLGGGTPWVR